MILLGMIMLNIKNQPSVQLKSLSAIERFEFIFIQQYFKIVSNKIFIS